jgi:hypothetical protein
LLLLLLLEFLSDPSLDMADGEMSQLCHLLARPPPADMRGQSAEINAVAIWAASVRPFEFALRIDTVFVPLIDALLKRGADMDGRAGRGWRCTGATALQCWAGRCVNAAGLMALLERGANLEASHQQGSTLMWILSFPPRVPALWDLIAAGWLDTVDVNRPADPSESTLAYLQKLDYSERAQQRDLLLAVRQNWPTHVRPAILRLLEAHQQLIRELAEIIVSYVRK